MEFYERELLVGRIMAGYVRCIVGNDTFLVHSPDIHENYEAQEFYISTILQCQGADIWTEQESIEFLMEQGLWTEENEEYYTNGLPAQIEEFKVELYNAMFKTETQKKVRKYLKVANDEYARLNNIRSMYFHTTQEGNALFSRLCFLVEKCTTHEDMRPCDWDEISLVQILSEYQNHNIEDSQIRELAKTDPWIGIWQANKPNPIFQNKFLDVHQKRLISWSLLYDNIQEAAEPPPKIVVDDDDMMDGWLISQRRKRESSENKQMVEGRAGNNLDASEVYIKVDSMKDARKVNQANDLRAQRIKKDRFNLVREKGQVKQHEFADVRLERQMQANQAGIDAAKGR